MQAVMEKEVAHRLVDQMPPESTWEDLMQQIYVREVIEKGLADCDAGHTAPVDDVRAKYGWPS